MKSEPSRFTVAEGLLLLAKPAGKDILSTWADADLALAGAVLVDLSLAGYVDSDPRDIFILNHRTPAEHAQEQALRILRPFGPSARLDFALNALVDRVGDLRSATLQSLAAKGVRLTKGKRLFWSFHQSAFSSTPAPQSVSLRNELVELVESSELPDPEQAAILSLLCACGIADTTLAGRHPQLWTTKNAARLDTLRRMDLVGHAVADAVADMRRRLRIYLLKADGTTCGSTYTRRKATWEWRAFWPLGQEIELPPVWADIGSQRAFVEEPAEDRYIFVHGKKDNIKIRGGGIKLKPVVEAFGEFVAFGPNTIFNFPKRTVALSPVFPRLYETRGMLHSTDDLLAALATVGYRPDTLTVSKKRRSLTMIFGVQIELARITIDGQIFHSISLESPYLSALRALARSIPAGDGLVAGYSEFLEQFTARSSARAKRSSRAVGRG